MSGANVRIGIMSDLHLGGSGEGRWHNRLMYDRVEDVSRAAIHLLNAQKLDRVVVLGDVTNGGTAAQLALAHSTLSGLRAPWQVLPGNHDGPAVLDGSFDRVFGRHVPDVYSRDGPIGLLFVRPRRELACEWDGIRMDWTEVGPALDAIAADPPALLLVFTHIPLVSEERWASGRGGKHTGDFADGPQLLARLGEVVPGKVVALGGHRHWHHVSHGRNWVQCTTGALIEYPMECRVLSVDEADGGIRARVDTLETASPELAARSLGAAAWVRGESEDRSFELAVRLPTGSLGEGAGTKPTNSSLRSG